MIRRWYVLVRENAGGPDVCGCGCKQKLTPEEIEANRNLPILIHWDKAQLPAETNGYCIVEVQPIGKLK